MDDEKNSSPLPDYSPFEKKGILPVSKVKVIVNWF